MRAILLGTKPAAGNARQLDAATATEALSHRPSAAAEPAPQQPESGIPGQVSAPSIEPYYFRGSELTVRPSALSDIPLEYPETRDPHVSGNITLRLLINNAGTVDKVVIENADVPEEFREVAVRAFTRGRFSPGKIGDQPVNSQMRIEVTFDNGQ